MKKNYKLMWADKGFIRILKQEAAKQDKSLVNLTSDLARKKDPLGFLDEKPKKRGRNGLYDFKI